MGRLIAAVIGTASATGAPGGYARATAQRYVASPDAYAQADATVDRLAYLACVGPVCMGGADVRIEGEDLASIEGTVQVSDALTSVETTAQFEVTDPRVGFSHPASLTKGNKPVEIDVRLGPPGGVKRFRVFAGYTEPGQNDRDTMPHGTFNASGNARRWTTLPVCLEYRAFSGLSRVEMLIAAAAAIGVPITNAAALKRGRPVRKPVSIRGITLAQLVNGANLDGRNGWGEIEGFWLIGNDDGSVTLIFDTDFDTAIPKVIFDDSNTEAMKETPPSRPVLDWILSATRITDDSAPGTGQRTIDLPPVGGIDKDGYGFYSKVRITTDDGVEIARTTEDYSTFQANGVTLGPLLLQLKRRVIETKSYQKAEAILGDASSLFYTTQLNNSKTEVYEVTGVPARIGSGYTWALGGNYTTASAQLIKTSETYTENTWNQTTCNLESSTTTISEFYLPLSDPADALNSSAFPDNTFRSKPVTDGIPPDFFLFTTTNVKKVYWQDYRDGIGFGAPTVLAVGTVSRYFTSSFAASPYDKSPIETFAAIDTETASWIGNSSNTHYVHTVQSRSAEALSGNANLVNQVIEEADGPVPGPPQGGEGAPAFAQQLFVRRFMGSAASGYIPSQVSEVNVWAETDAELLAVVKRRIRWELADSIATTGPWITNARSGDIVGLVDRSRSIPTVRAGMLWSADRKMIIGTGLATMDTVIRIPLAGI